MDNFLQAFAAGMEESGDAPSVDESPASRVNVVLLAARRFVESPDKEREYFKKELLAFRKGIEEAQGTLEDLHEEASEEEQWVLELAHDDLAALAESGPRLETILDAPDASKLDQLRNELLVPTYRLLLAKETLENLGAVLVCPYCGAENSKQAQRCEACGKPLSTPDPLAQEGELFPVPLSITQLLQLCFQVAQDPDTHLNAWLQHLHTLTTQFSTALRKVQQAMKREKPESVAHQEFKEMERGLLVLLDGFEEIGSFEQSGQAEVLDTGWVNMMSGFKVFKLAGDRLAIATAKSQ